MRKTISIATKFRYWVSVPLLLLSLIIMMQSVYAHPGRTASDGCHYCRTNCGSWGGTAYGVRHCHQNKGVPQPHEPIRSHRDGTYEIWEQYKIPKVSNQYEIDVSNINGIFYRSLSIGSVGEDVHRLQRRLNKKGFIVSYTGPGSSGRETYYFGEKTKRALIKYQNFYRSEILDPIGLHNGTGYFGPITMMHMNMEYRQKFQQ